MKLQDAGISVPVGGGGSMSLADAGVVDAPITATGLGKSFVSGARTGIEGMAGVGGDLFSWETRKAAELAKALGASPETVTAIQNYGPQPTRGPPLQTMPVVRAETDAAVKAALPADTAATVQDVSRHAPQNWAERYSDTAGQLAPAAAAPGGPMARIARVLF